MCIHVFLLVRELKRVCMFRFVCMLVKYAEKSFITVRFSIEFDELLEVKRERFPKNMLQSLCERKY